VREESAWHVIEDEDEDEDDYEIDSNSDGRLIARNRDRFYETPHSSLRSAGCISIDRERK